MLGKLFCHEWKRVSKIGIVLNLVAAGVTLLGVIYLCSPLWKGLFGGSDTFAYYGSVTFSIVSILSALGGVLTYMLVIGGISLGMMIYLGVRYYKTVFGDEGYLLHTLPVKPSEILIAKIGVGSLWMLITQFVAYLMFAVVIIVAFANTGDTGIAETFKVIGEYLSDLFRDYGSIVLSYVILYAIAPMVSIAIFFGAMTLGQYFSMARGFLGVVMYFLVLFVETIVITCLNAGINGMILSSVRNDMNSRDWTTKYMTLTSNVRMFTTLGVNLLFAVVLCLWAHHVISKKLNME